MSNTDVRHITCLTCPSRFLAPGEFARASRAERPVWQLNEADEYRVDISGAPICIHPERLGSTALELVAAGDAAARGIDFVEDPARAIAAILRTTDGALYELTLDQLWVKADEAGLSDQVFVDACRAAFQIMEE